MLNKEFLAEVVAVGVLVVVVGYLLHRAALYVGYHDLNNMKSYATHLFLTGALVHVFAELSGINAWYCDMGVACRL
jgi:cytochrome c oxidase assembly factor CtaG